MIYIEKIVNTHSYQNKEAYPYNIDSIRNLSEIELRKDVTFIVGENGSGKSTLVEAIAINAGFNPEGGGRNFNFSTNDTHSQLYEDIKLVRGPYRNKDGYFMRAESFYNVASEIDEIDGAVHYYGGKSLHNCSHGESFLALFQNRLYGDGLYVFDEPEAALSLKSMFAMLVRIKELTEKKSQFIIATHSPILLAYPDAGIYSVTENGIDLIDYEDTEQYQLTKFFINDYHEVIKELFG